MATIYANMGEFYDEFPKNEDIHYHIDDTMLNIGRSVKKIFEGKREKNMKKMLVNFYMLATSAQFIYMNKNCVYTLKQAEDMSMLLDYFTDTLKEMSTLLKHEIDVMYGSRMNDNVLQNIVTAATEHPIVSSKEAKRVADSYIPKKRKKTRRRNGSN
jgi:hypothetical protein